MSCPNGQIQIGFNPTTQQAVCVDTSLINNSSTSSIPLTGATMSSGNSGWWNQVIDTIPGMLTGVANIIGASKGNDQPDNITIVQTPVEERGTKSFPWGAMIITVIVIVFILIMWLKYKTRK